MIRNDFVSNSSSSSFICTQDDSDNINIYGTCSHISLQEIVDKWERDTFGYGYYDRNRKITFISDSDYSKKFGHIQSCALLPISVKDLINKYIDIRNNLHIEYSKELIDKLTKLKSKISDKLYKILKPEWYNIDFIRIDSNDDCYIDGISHEELMEEEFYKLYNSKFFRVYNNH